MSSRVIDVALRLRDHFTQPFNKAVKSMTAFSKEGMRVRKSIDKTGKAITRTGTMLTAAITVPLVGIGAASVKEFGEVNKSLKLVQATMKSSDKEARGLEKAVEEAASNSVFGMQDAADATLNYARQGFNAKEAADMLSPALDLAAGTATDLSVVTGGLGNALKMFGKDSSYASTAADIFAAAQAQANTTTTDLFEAMSTAGPIFKTVGWSMSDLAVATDIFGDAGISGSEGAIAMKTGLSRLASPAKDAREWISALNLDLFEQDGRMKSMIEVQSQLHNAMSKLTDQEKLQAASALFGKNQMSKWLTLIDAAPEQVKAYSDSLENCAGTAHNMSEALLSGVGGSLEKLSSAWDVAKYNIGKFIGEAVKPCIDGITSLINGFNKLDDVQQKQIVKWGVAAAAVGPTLIVVGKLVSGISKAARLISVISNAGGAVSALAAAFSAPAAAVVGVAVAITATIALMVATVVKHIDEFKAEWADISEKISPYAANVTTAISSLKTAAAPVLSFFEGVFASGLLGVLRGLGNGIVTVFDGIATAINGFAEIFNGIVGVIKGIASGDWSAAWKSMKDTVIGVVDVILGGLETLVGMVQGTVSAIGNAAKGIWGFVTGKSNKQEIPGHASGTPYFAGGLTRVNEKGGEIMRLPSGTQIIPHDLSRNKAPGSSISIPKLADQIIVREDADIDRIASAIAKEISAALKNTGGYSYSGNMA